MQRNGERLAAASATIVCPMVSWLHVSSFFFFFRSC